MDSKELGKVYYVNETDLVNFYVLNKQKDYEKALYVGKETERYIKLRYQLFKINYLED